MGSVWSGALVNGSGALCASGAAENPLFLYNTREVYEGQNNRQKNDAED